MKNVVFNYKLSILLILSFMLMTVVGTLTHELGHYTVSKLLGYEASINYQSSSHWDHELDSYFKEVYAKYSNEIKNKIDFPGKEQYQSTVERYRNDDFWILLGGPLQTTLTGSIGFVLLLFYRSKVITPDNVSFRGWVLIFISLFWLRQVANLFMAVLSLVIKGQPSMSGDEIRLALHLDIPIWTIQIITGLIGLTVLVVILRLLPRTMLFTFLVSGLTGGVLGYYLWLVKFGPYIMP